jgi:hypothetical protein
MTIRTIALGICSVLLAVCCAIGYLATKETYDLFARSPAEQATIVGVRPGPERVEVRFSLIEAGKRVVHDSRVPSGGPRLQVGQRVKVHRHANVPSRFRLAIALDDERPSPWLAAGTLAFLGLAGYVLILYPRRVRQRRAARTSGLDVIVDSLSRTRNLNLGVGIGLVAFGGMLIWLQIDSRNVAQWVMVGALALLFLVIGGLGMWRGLRQLNPRRNALMRVIEEHPEQIVSVTVQIVTTEGVPQSAMSLVDLRLAGGSRHALQVAEDDRDLLLDELARRAPQAFGDQPPPAADLNFPAQ